MHNDHIPHESGEMRRHEEDCAVTGRAASAYDGERQGAFKTCSAMACLLTWHAGTSPVPHGIGGLINQAASSSAALWLGGAALGLVAVILAYVGVVLVAALKADTPELQRYRSSLLRELLRFIREMCRGGKKH